MTCRRPTISVRMEVLERLARANSEPGAPDSMEFTPVSFRDIDRDSFTEGLSDLLAYQEERVREGERQKLEELEEKARHRARQRDEARKWELSQMEKKRAEVFQRRVEAAKERAAREAQELLADRHAFYDAELRTQAHEAAFEREITEVEVRRTKKRYARFAQGFALAAAAVALVWGGAFEQDKSRTSAEIAELWQSTQAERESAQSRVAELENEIQRRVNLSESERASLEDELDRARADLESTKKELEEIDRRKPVERPSKMAKVLTPVNGSSQKKSAETQKSAPSDSDTKVRVATDEAQIEGCLPFDPLCFDL